MITKQTKLNPAPFSRALALDPNPSPMRFNQVSGNRQADASVPLGAGAGFVHLVETLQDVRSAARELLLA